MLEQIQIELKVKKSRYNKFGDYNYRSGEDILEAVKPILHKHGLSIVMIDDVVEVCGSAYVKAQATIYKGVEPLYYSYGFAREGVERKKMHPEQLTGSASSYARKYALQGLFAIDDGVDSDSTNKHEKIEVDYNLAPFGDIKGKPWYSADIPTLENALDYFASKYNGDDGQSYIDAISVVLEKKRKEIPATDNFEKGEV